MNRHVLRIENWELSIGIFNENLDSWSYNFWKYESSEERFVWITLFTGNLSLRIENWELRIEYWELNIDIFYIQWKLRIENWELLSFIFNENLDRRMLDGWILKISRIHLSQSSQDIYLPIVVCNSIFIFHRKLERNVARRWTKKKIVVSTRATIFNSIKLNNRSNDSIFQNKPRRAGFLHKFQKDNVPLSLSAKQRESPSFFLPSVSKEDSTSLVIPRKLNMSPDS